MGLLEVNGVPLQWGTPENNAAINTIRKEGVEQFINLYKKYKDLDNCPFLWGDELEHMLVEEEEVIINNNNNDINKNNNETDEKKEKKIKLSLCAAEVLEVLLNNNNNNNNNLNNNNLNNNNNIKVDWRPEYGSFVVESVPGEPYNTTLESLISVEENMKMRYKLLDEAANNINNNNKKKIKRYGCTLVTYPLMGVGNFTASTGNNNNNNINLNNNNNNNYKLSSPYSKSLFIPDICINNTHPRFSTLTANIRERRGSKVCIQVPLYIDKYTISKTVDHKLNIDYTDRNKDISCDVGNNNINNLNNLNNNNNSKKKKGRKFGEIEDVTVVEGGHNNNNNNNNLDNKNNNNKKNINNIINIENNNINNININNNNNIITTPSLDYYYAQYSATPDSEKRRIVKERYHSCPCPILSNNNNNNNLNNNNNNNNYIIPHPCIYMDCMAFGMGCNCLQITLQLKNINQARHIFDQLVVLCPVFLALSSATPFQKGLLCDSDVRWLTISSSVDDRKPSEVPNIIKSRYDSVSGYISSRTKNIDYFNDSYVEINRDVYDYLIDEKSENGGNLDKVLAKHIAHLFIRDPLVVFDKAININNKTRSDHFENIQSTNWQTVRFKPPPINTDIGWRVEFRVMDILPTPFENAAFSVFFIILTRAIIYFDCNFYLKISVVDENIGRAHRRDPCKERYAFRRNIFENCENIGDDEINNNNNNNIAMLTIDEIFNGEIKGNEDDDKNNNKNNNLNNNNNNNNNKEIKFIGLVPLVQRYINTAEEAKQYSNNNIINKYINFISMRAAGVIPTTANYWRNFIINHNNYKKDSRITESIANDIIIRSINLANNNNNNINDNNNINNNSGQKRGREGD